MSAAEFIDHNDNRIAIGTDSWVIIQLPNDKTVTVYRNGHVTRDDGAELPRYGR